MRIFQKNKGEQLMEEIIILTIFAIPIVVFIGVVVYGRKKKDSKWIMKSIMKIDVTFFILYEAIRLTVNKIVTEALSSDISLTSLQPGMMVVIILTVWLYLIILISLIIYIIEGITIIIKNKKKIEKNP